MNFFSRNLLVVLGLLGCSWQAGAVHFTLSQAGPPTWTYTLTFDPEDNYSVSQTNTTITLNGLSGVTAAGGPTSDTFPAGALNTSNLAWTPQVLNGGTTVVWTKVGGGTGNFATAQYVYGFSVTAAGASNGTVSYATSGMSRDAGNPLPGGGFNLDISGAIGGPGGTVTSVPATSSLTLVAMSVGLALAGAYQARERMSGSWRG